MAVSIVEVRVERAEENQWSSCLGEGVFWGWGFCELFNLSVGLRQSVFSQRGLD